MTDLVIKSLADLEDVELSNNKTLEEHPHFNFYYERAYSFYQEIVKEGFEWRPFQPRYAAIYCCRRNNISALTMGLGKTIIAILNICALYCDQLDEMNRGSIQIVAPSELSITTRWLEELNKLNLTARNVGFLKTKKDLKESTKPIWIYHHDFPKLRLKERRGNRDYYSKVLSKCNLLVVDEAHQLKEKTSRSKHISYLVGRSKRVLLMSGTISDGRLDLIHFLCKMAYGRYWPFKEKKDFRDKYSSRKNVKTNYISGFGNESDRTIYKLAPSKVTQYARLIQSYIHRAGYSDTNIQPYVHIPDRQTIVEPIKPSTEHVNHYYSIVEHEKDRIERARRYYKGNMRAQALQLLHPIIRASNCPPDWVSNRKLERLIERVEEQRVQGGRTAVFCEGVDAARTVTLALKEQGYNTVRMYAKDEEYDPPEQKPSKRKEVVNKFLFDDETDAGVFSMNLASESIDLTSASQVIFYDYPWGSTKLQQALFRVVRPGNNRKSIRAVYLKNQGFIDEHQQNLLAEKIDSINLMLDFDAYSMDTGQGTINLEEVVKNVIS